MTVLLLPSPFLGPSASRPLVEALRRAGRDAVLADASDPGSGTELVARWAGAACRADALVAHSNAGYLAPLVQAAVDPGHPLVLVDAALPPARGTTRLAPDGFRDHLAGLADDDGLLPPWTRWWDEADLAAVVPAEHRAAVEADCPRVPLAYVDSSVTAPAEWTDGPSAYLAYGDTYADEVAAATSYGWPVARLDGGHLHHLVDPETVAAEIVRLLGSLEDRSWGPARVVPGHDREDDLHSTP
ncbi:hypothetical protein [Lapillicoccus jejuensis]|uniref:Alpha/beta hydrolase family protein n=1 Tax=Lapillicoccus jejuensis TaxID=402171 RepID=A0A542DZF0_9MICO|nr:hypothetical protein [Lapillicoccus jejuensis]TQJ08465.1 hypothetical protein FB458_1555 [Lapillicoccus jejuensis]